MNPTDGLSCWEVIDDVIDEIWELTASECYGSFNIFHSRVWTLRHVICQLYQIHTIPGGATPEYTRMCERMTVWIALKQPTLSSRQARSLAAHLCSLCPEPSSSEQSIIINAAKRLLEYFGSSLRAFFDSSSEPLTSSAEINLVPFSDLRRLLSLPKHCDVTDISQSLRNGARLSVCDAFKLNKFDARAYLNLVGNINIRQFKTKTPIPEIRHPVLGLMTPSSEAFQGISTLRKAADSGIPIEAFAVAFTQSYQSEQWRQRLAVTCIKRFHVSALSFEDSSFLIRLLTCVVTDTQSIRRHVRTAGAALSNFLRLCVINSITMQQHLGHPFPSQKKLAAQFARLLVYDYMTDIADGEHGLIIRLTGLLEPFFDNQKHAQSSVEVAVTACMECFFKHQSLAETKPSVEGNTVPDHVLALSAVCHLIALQFDSNGSLFDHFWLILRSPPDASATTLIPPPEPTPSCDIEPEDECQPIIDDIELEQEESDVVLTPVDDVSIVEVDLDHVSEAQFTEPIEPPTLEIIDSPMVEPTSFETACSSLPFTPILGPCPAEIITEKLQNSKNTLKILISLQRTAFCLPSIDYEGFENLKFLCSSEIVPVRSTQLSDHTNVRIEALAFTENAALLDFVLRMATVTKPHPCLQDSGTEFNNLFTDADVYVIDLTTFASQELSMILALLLIDYTTSKTIILEGYDSLIHDQVFLSTTLDLYKKVLANSSDLDISLASFTVHPYHHLMDLLHIPAQGLDTKKK